MARLGLHGNRAPSATRVIFARALLMPKHQEGIDPKQPRDLDRAGHVGQIGMKQDVFKGHGRLFRATEGSVARRSRMDLETSAVITTKDKRLAVTYQDKGRWLRDLKVAGRHVIFHMHTNVFKLDQSHSLWKTSYLEDDEMRGYFGVINVYNFLSDSFKYNRERDLGYLVARLFLNKEGHFFVQGKRQLGFLYNDLA
jgi:hypothetical protein